MENKKFEELTELNEELNLKKKEGLLNIKERFDYMSSNSKIDVEALQDAINEIRLKVRFAIKY
jgi:hypothetical protein